MWLIFAMLSAVFAGVTAVLAKVGIKNVRSNLATAVRCIVVLIFSWLMAFITAKRGELMAVSPRTLVFLVLSGLATGASWLCYFRALQLGDVNRVTPVDKFSVVLTLVLAAAFLGEPMSAWKWVAVALIAVGTYIMIEKKPGEEGRAGKNWFIYACGSMVFASLTSILGKVGISGIDSNLGTAIRTVVVLIMAWVVVFAGGEQSGLRTIDRRSMVFILLSGITTGASWLCYYRALQIGRAGYVVAVDKLSVLVTIALPAIVLKEKLSRRGGLGLAVLVLGTLLLVAGDYI